MRRYSPPQRLAWLFFWLSAVTAIGLFFIPAFIIRPFAHQTAAGLSLALALRQRAPWATIIALFVCAVVALRLWQFDNPRRKIVLSVVLLVAVFSAVMSRLNY